MPKTTLLLEIVKYNKACLGVEKKLDTLKNVGKPTATKINDETEC